MRLCLETIREREVHDHDENRLPPVLLLLPRQAPPDPLALHHCGRPPGAEVQVALIDQSVYRAKVVGGGSQAGGLRGSCR